MMVQGDEKAKAVAREIESLRQRVEELERLEEERKRREESLLDLFNATEEVALLMDREGIILVANKNAARLYATPMEKLTGVSIYDLIPTSRIESSKEKVKKVLETRKPVRFEGKLEDRVFENSLYPVVQDGAEIQRIAIYVRDITEKKRLALILKQTEEKYRMIYENAVEGIFQISPDGRFISANPSLARIHGYGSPEELIQEDKNIASMYAKPEDHHRLVRLLFEKGSVQNYEVEMVRKDGSLHWISVNVRLVRDEQGKPLYYEGTMMDITHRKRAEEALAESEERYRTAIEHSNDAVAIIRRDEIQYVNRRFVDLFGYDRREDVIGKPVTLVVHPDDREMVLTINRRRQRGEPVPDRYEFKGIARDGRAIYIEVSAASILYRGIPEYLVYLRDITERIQAHEALLRSHRELEQLNRAKTKAINHISHELRTPLAVIQGNIRLLKRRLNRHATDPKLKAIMAALERNLERLSEISRETHEIFSISKELEVSDLLDNLDALWQRIEELPNIPQEARSHLEALKGSLGQYLSGKTEEFQSINLFLFVLDVLEKVKQLSNHRRIQFQVEGKNDLYVFIDPLILYNVVEGLLRNAIENTPDGGMVRVAVEQKNGKTALHITDDGIGITKENQAYIFSGLFHTKETELYASKKPYDFGAGGKGLDLLRMKVYGQRFGFDLSMTSRRCVHIPRDQDLCPGDISKCPHVDSKKECAQSGGTTFTVAFQPIKVSQPGHI